MDLTVAVRYRRWVVYRGSHGLRAALKATLCYKRDLHTASLSTDAEIRVFVPWHRRERAGFGVMRVQAGTYSNAVSLGFGSRISCCTGMDTSGSWNHVIAQRIEMQPVTRDGCVGGLNLARAHNMIVGAKGYAIGRVRNSIGLTR